MNRPPVLRGLAAIAMLTGGLLAAGPARAQPAVPYPGRAVTLVVPFAAGGFTDVVARVVAQGLAKGLGQPVVVENRPGAGSTIGADLVAKAPPDGYQILMISTTHVISESLYRKLPYDTMRSFTPIAKIAEAPYVLVVNPAVQAQTVQELIALAKARPGRLDYGSSGNGSSQHMMGALFSTMAGIQTTHVPYRGSAQAATDLVAGVVQFGFMGTPVAIKQSRAGLMRPLAVTSATRSPQMPEVPTLNEAGVGGYDASVWLGLLAPAGTPEPIVARLHAEVAKVMADADTRTTLVGAGVDPSVVEPKAFGELMVRERDKWAKVVKDTGAKVE